MTHRLGVGLHEDAAHDQLRCRNLQARRYQRDTTNDFSTDGATRDSAASKPPVHAVVITPEVVPDRVH
jgi:hypothetical protein